MCVLTPREIAVATYRAHHADRIVAERNNGGGMVW